MDEPRRPSHAPWALAVAAVAIVAIVVGRGALRLPLGAQPARRTCSRAAARPCGTCARWRRPSAPAPSPPPSAATRPRSPAPRASSSPSCGRRSPSSAATARPSCGATLALPDVVVEARAPVTYTYFLDLDKEWRFRLEGRDVLVVVPPVEWNRPAVDVSALRFEVREGSVLRDEQVVLDRLRAELTPLLERRARQHVPLVREAGRRKVEAFVETWLVQRFADGRDYRARVVFADEPAAARRGRRPSAPVG